MLACFPVIALDSEKISKPPIPQPFIQIKNIHLTFYKSQLKACIITTSMLPR